MITVRTWPYLGSNIAYGHASVQIDGGEPSGPVYISWWPQETSRDYYFKQGLNLYCVASIPDRTYLDDVAGEDGRLPSHFIAIDGSSSTTIGLNEAAMKAWWLNLTRSGSTNWCTLDPNCSTITAMALFQGGGDDLCESYWTSHNAVWTPNDVTSYAWAIVAGIKEARSGPPPGADGSGDGGLPGGT